MLFWSLITLLFLVGIFVTVSVAGNTWFTHTHTHTHTHCVYADVYVCDTYIMIKFTYNNEEDESEPKTRICCCVIFKLHINVVATMYAAI